MARGRNLGLGRADVAVDIEAFTARLDAMMDRVPPALLRGLDGGVSVSEDERRRRGDPPGVYILGESVTDPHLGCLIVLEPLAGQADAVWEREMWDALRREIRNHVEDMAGVSGLDVEDLLELERMRADGCRPAARTPQAAASTAPLTAGRKSPPMLTTSSTPIPMWKAVFRLEPPVPKAVK
jgi:hypothetical protein